VGKLHLLGRTHQVKVKPAGALCQVLAHAQLWAEGQAPKREP